MLEVKKGREDGPTKNIRFLWKPYKYMEQIGKK